VITVFHNPSCGTSRKVLETLRDAGETPTVIEYLKTGWTRAQLVSLFQAAGLAPRQALRTRGGLAEELGLLKDGVSDAAILNAMIAHPVLVERPFVVAPKGTALCRPPQKALALLDHPPRPEI